MINAVSWQWFQQSLILNSFVLHSESKCIHFTYVQVPLIPHCHNHAFLLFVFHLTQWEASVLFILVLGVSKWVFNAPIRKHYHCRVSFCETGEKDFNNYRNRHWKLCLEQNFHQQNISDWANFKNTMHCISALQKM